VGIDDRLVRWCERHLGSGPAERFFGADHLSEVHGLRLADGREVVLKLRGRLERPLGCDAVHRAVWAAGIPSPEPLVGPQALADDEPDRWVTAEEWVPASEIRVPEPGLYARLLAQITAAAPDVADVPSLAPTVPWLWFDHDDPGRTWPPPAHDRWDPHRIEAELPPFALDAARRARARLLADEIRALPTIITHGDLSGINTRWWADDHDTGGFGRVVRPLFVVHDWDSVVALPEAVVAGSTAGDFVSHDRTRLAPLAQTERFLAAYAEARGRPWTAAETEIAYAADAWLAAYNVAFEHLKDGPYPVTEQFAVDAAEILRRAGA
jgi:hypothetical protein